MKGSREKRGILRETLTVKWAPDVYDPPPTLISHSVKSKSSQKYKNKKNEKRNGRKGQRGNHSQGGSGKDKKHIHKSTKISGKFGNYEVGSSNSYCGSSFRQKSRTEVHYSIAEASWINKYSPLMILPVCSCLFFLGGQRAMGGASCKVLSSV